MLIVVMMAYGIGIFSGCQKTYALSAKAYISGNVLELPIKGQIPNDPHGYYIDKSINEIYAEISADESLDVILKDNKIFISKENQNELYFSDDNKSVTKDYYLILEGVTVDGKRIYEFSDSTGYLVGKSGFSYALTVLIPYHLLEVEVKSIFSPGFYANDETIAYETKYDIEDFYEFYAGSGWYEVERQENEIHITDYTRDIKVIHYLTGIPNCDRSGIRFEKGDSINTIKFTHDNPYF